jgi:rhodanese-related sulfurtransferase
VQRRTVDELLAEARARYERVSAERAFREQREGATIVDTRTYEQRRDVGLVPGAVVIDRTVFEWRLDPASPWHDDWVADHDQRVIVVCREGYSSSLAVASLLDLGLHRATDVIGGVDAWREAGLPLEPMP